MPYSPDDYTRDGVLKVSFLMWVVVIYLSRHILILLLGGLSQFMASRTGTDTSAMATLYSNPAFVVASVPAMVILATHCRRIMGARQTFRWLWSKGAWLLGTAAALDGIILLCHWALGVFTPNELQIAGLFVDSYILAYLIRSKRVKDTFADFPAPD